MNKYSAVAERVISGDTLVITVDLGFRIKHTLRVKLRDIELPNKKTIVDSVLADKAKIYLRELVMNQELLITTYKRHNEYTADIWVGHARQSVTDMMQLAAANNWS